MCVNANLCLFQGPGPSPPSWIHFTSPYCHPRMSAPWSNFLSAIIWWVRTVSHWQVRMTLGLCRSWLLNVALAPYQAPVCLVLTAPTGLATGGRLLGQLATEGCNHSLWHIWHKPSICCTTESFEWLPCLILLGQERATLRWEINIWKTLYTPTLQWFISYKIRGKGSRDGKVTVNLGKEHCEIQFEKILISIPPCEFNKAYFIIFICHHCSKGNFAVKMISQFSTR